MEEAETMGGDATEADRLFAAQSLGHGLQRRIALDLGAETVGNDDADIVREHVEREVVADRKISRSQWSR